MVFAHTALGSGLPGTTQAASSPEQSGPLSWFRSNADLGFQPHSNLTVSATGTIVIGDGRQLVGLQLQDGSTRWRRELAYHGEVSPVNAGEMLAVVLPDGRTVKGIALTTGDDRWSVRLETTAISMQGQGDDLYLLFPNQTLTKLKATTGETGWSVRVENLWGVPVPAPGVCILPNVMGELVALSADTGMPLWRFPLRGRLASPVVTDGKRVYAFTHSEILYAIDAASGELVRRFEFGTGKVYWWPTAGVNGRVQPWGGHLALLENSGANHLRVVTIEGQPQRDFRRFEHPDILVATATSEVLALLPRIGSGQAYAYAPTSRQVATFQPPPGTLLALAGSTEEVIALTTQGVGGFTLTRAGWPVLFKKFRVNLSDAVSFMMLGALAVWFVGHYVNVHRIQLPPRHSAGAKLCLVFALVVACSVALLSLSWVIIKAIACGILPVVSAGTAGLLALASLIPVLTFTFGHHEVMRRLRTICTSEGNRQSFEAVFRETAQLSEELGLGRPVRLVIAPVNGLSPMVYGRSPQDAVLVLPQNFPSLCELATAGDRPLSRHLARFVLAHELAHVRHGDVWITPLLMALRGPWLAAWGGLLACYWSHRMAHGDPILLHTVLTGTLLLGGEILLMAWLCRSLLVERERLADATAVLVSSPEAIDALTRRNDGVSSLERFVALLRPNPFLVTRGQSFLGAHVVTALVGVVQRLVPNGLHRRIRSFRLTLLQRTGQAKRRTAALGIRQVDRPELTAVQFGLCLALLYAAVMSGVRASDWLANLPIAAAIESPWLICASIPQDYSVLAGHAAWLASGFQAAFPILLVVLLAMGLVDSNVAGHVSEEGARWRLFGRTLLAVGVAGGAVWLVHRVAPFGFQWKGDKLALIPLAGALALVFSWLIGLVTGKRDTSDEEPMAVMLGEFALCLVILWEVSARLVSGGLFERMASTSVGIFICLIAHQLVSRHIIRAAVVQSERIVGTSILRWQVVTDWRPWQPVWRLGTTALAFAPWITMVGLGVAIFLWLGGPAYLELLDRLAGAPRSAMFEWFFPTGKLSGQGGIGDSVSLISYAVLVDHDPFKLGLHLMFSAILGVLGARIHGHLVTGPKSTAIRLARQRVTEAVELLLQLPDDGLQRTAKKWCELTHIESANASRATTDYLETYRLPALRTSAMWVLAARQAEVPRSRVLAMLDWIGRCATPAGGFGPIPGGTATEFHTVWALRALHSHGYLQPATRSAAERWLRSRLGRTIRPPAPIRPSQFLDSTYHLLSGLAELESLGRLGRRTKASLLTRSAQAWLQSHKSVADTFHLQAIAALVEEPVPDSAARQLRQYWLPLHEADLPRMDPRQRPREVAQLIQIVRWLYPDDYLNRASVKQALDLLKRTLATDVEFLRQQLRGRAVNTSTKHELAD
jgi:Zn-dependent protease with chaperone function